MIALHCIVLAVMVYWEPRAQHCSHVLCVFPAKDEACKAFRIFFRLCRNKFEALGVQTWHMQEKPVFGCQFNEGGTTTTPRWLVLCLLFCGSSSDMTPVQYLHELCHSHSNLFCFFRYNLPPCFSPSPCCGKASLGSSGSESIGVRGQLLGRWSGTRWSTWSVRLRTSTGSAGRTWLQSRSTATPRSAGPRTGSRSKRPNFPSSLNINSSQITWVTWKSPRHGQVNVSRKMTCKNCLRYVTACLRVLASLVMDGGEAALYSCTCSATSRHLSPHRAD